MVVFFSLDCRLPSSRLPGALPVIGDVSLKILPFEKPDADTVFPEQTMHVREPDAYVDADHSETPFADPKREQVQALAVGLGGGDFSGMEAMICEHDAATPLQQKESLVGKSNLATDFPFKRPQQPRKDIDEEDRN